MNIENLNAVQLRQLLYKQAEIRNSLVDALKDVMAQAARHSNPDSAAMTRARQALSKAESGEV